ncbi:MULTISPECIES: HupE/UreJ family protein [Nonlabens]|uniref:HupE/UreJ protein n=1 Tax=Nonlabens xylanidelens TaxID=191564 RepID=A0A2S6ISA9_9FLAO|nr:HupE/UreJ family protein [Nonlabens xylanidelens]PPK97030.1 HupE/UreJ protein [Nonlabens xylanidelens]PQJ13717.1 HupE / UreJ protein [Nonlabens xylanidelens]
MDDFILYVKEGFYHVMNFNVGAYDHVLFFILMAVPFLFNSWKKLLGLSLAFTVGHILSLLLVIYGKVSFNSSYIEFLIVVTIAITALYNIFTAGKRHRDNHNWITMIFALFFGLIHGFGFSSGFKMLAAGAESDLLMLLEFALGLELGQLLIILVILILNFIFTGIFRFNKKEWVQIISSIILGMILPLLIVRWIF